MDWNICSKRWKPSRCIPQEIPRYYWKCGSLLLGVCRHAPWLEQGRRNADLLVKQQAGAVKPAN
jgi:hypothetical protein